MKVQLLFQKLKRTISTPTAIVASISIVAITTTSFLPVHSHSTDPQQDNIAYAMLNTDESGNLTEVQDEYKSEPVVTIPTESPSATDIMPEDKAVETSPYESIVATIVSETLMHTDQKGHPVSMQVKRQINGNTSMQDTAKIDVKEAALTVDMLRRDTGNTAYLSMPAPPEMPPAAQLELTFTARAQQLFANSQLGISIQAWHGRMTMPSASLQSDKEDVTISLGTDEKTAAPQGALSKSLEFVVSEWDQSQDVWIVLPLPKEKFSKSDLSHLAIYAEYPDGTHKYLKGKITDYTATSKGIQFATNQSGKYTIVKTKEIL